jgi:predicted O-methyltransferase YrrM
MNTKYKFNKDFDWFSNHIQIWEKVLIPIFKDKPINVIELGSFEGRSATWLLDNILTHPKASIDCVDNNTPDIVNDTLKIDWKEIHNNLIYNLGLHINKARLHELSTTQYLKERNEPSDLIYVDAGHLAFEALTDAVLSNLLLKRGGIIIFDDYLWTQLESNPRTPKPAIDAFIECFAQLYKPISFNYQVILQKI